MVVLHHPGKEMHGLGGRDCPGCFSATGASRFSVSMGASSAVCVCMSNPGDSKKSPGGDKRHFLRVSPFFFFFIPPLDPKTNSDPRKSAFIVSKVVTESSLTLRVKMTNLI